MPARKPFSNVTRASEPALLHVALVSALTAYDAREERKALKRRGGMHNHYALAHYLSALAWFEEKVAKGADVREAIVDCFCGRLLDHVLRAIHEPIATAEERLEHPCGHSSR